VNPKRKPLALTRKEQALYDEYVLITRFVAAKSGCPSHKRDELEQHLRIALVGIIKHESRDQKHRDVPLGAFVRLMLKQRAVQFLFGRGNLAAIRNAERFERSENEIVGKTDEGEDQTLGEIAENILTRRNPPGDHLQSRLFDIRQAIEKLPAFERKVLKLTYFDGLETAAAAKRLKVTGIRIKRTLRAAIQGLRAQFPGSLTSTAPLPKRGRDNARHWRYR